MDELSPTRIILADDHNIVRRGLAALLQLDGTYEVVCEAENGEEALQCAANIQAHFIILDLSMPRLNGLETVRRLHHHYPTIKILILSMYDDVEFVVQTLRDGADGYILKHSLEDELFDALAAIRQGKRFVSTAITLSDHDEQENQVGTQLTSREHEVLQLIAEGYTTTEIADIMTISPHTANRHRANILKKMGVRNQMELVRLAIQRGLVILNQPPQSIRPT
ncbi:MAG: response regulator transcription factor [Anaerolineae bacterium]|nr:response regulator transcription factor [Anaerolineae bacterium]